MNNPKSLYLSHHPTRKPILKIGLITILVLLFHTNYAFAHRVNVFAWIEDKTIHTQSKFPGGKPVVACEILVFNLERNLITKGVTDNNGEFSFKSDNPQPMKIELNAGMGHKAVWEISAEDIDETYDENDSEPLNTEDISHENDSDSLAIPDKNVKQMEVVIEKALDRKLKPVYKMLADLKEDKPSLKDILGGIGYIIGLIGLASYIRYKKPNKK